VERILRLSRKSISKSPQPPFCQRGKRVENKVLLSFLLIGTILFIHARLVAPRRRLRRFREQMASWNWREQSAEQTPGWQTFEKAAVQGVFGQNRQTAYERKIGFLKSR
jgi:hypothetical protein